MNGYENLYSAIIPDLAKHYQITEFDFRNNLHTTSVALCRSHLYKLILIELYLHEHRLKYKNSLISLDGLNSLHHLVFQKTNWSFEQINSLSLYAKLFVLLDEIVPSKLSDKAQSYLEVISKSQNLLPVDLASYADWVIGSGDQFLKYN
ncbi:TPA: hypothetical protein LVL98_005352 [Klebsiella michiganensis]|jgi:hypothetical protein|nr:hypothetical protein [Klebsiella michiganensis]